MSRMHYLTTVLLVTITASGTWYGTREVTRNQDRAEALAGRLADAQAHTRRLAERIAMLEATPSGAQVARPGTAETTLPPAAGSAHTNLSHVTAGAMQAIDQQLNVIANNLANVNTVGYKRSRVNFEDMRSGTADQATGVKITGVQLDLSPGPMITTNHRLDLAIAGEGFFQVKTRKGNEELTAYTRAGNFVRNTNGQLVLANSIGSPLEPPITIPENVPASGITINSDGLVQVQQDGSSELTQIGQVELARFVSADGLVPISGNLFVETAASGSPITGNPDTDGMGKIQQACLEGSNVQIEREKVDLMFAQRAFEINSQFLQGQAYHTAIASTAK